eukprot:374035-Pelagomonas_calceolata.AAC.10
MAAGWSLPSMHACWSICDGTSTLPQPPIQQAPTRPVGRLLDLFTTLAPLIRPWGGRVGCKGVVGCLPGGLSHLRPSLLKTAP